MSAASPSIRLAPSRYTLPRPFLKWVGGKGQLLGTLLARVSAAGEFRTYHEPFVGGGALFFELHRQGALRDGAVLSDKNPNLVEVWQTVREDVGALVERLAHLKARHNEEHYYAVRAEVPADRLGRAARIIYLNKTCFNGLYRENRRGGFNVPFGRYSDPPILDEENLRACSIALQDVELRSQGFEEAARAVRSGDFVYFDPPYVPVSKTSVFTAYQKGGFGEADQRRLAQTFRDLTAKNARVMLSNSWAPLVLECYGEFGPQQIQASRNLNSRGDKRGAVAEALVDNFASILPARRLAG
ncbi:site-specific DNA-methyltransferase [Deltaproteobacteria bacterium]|nr:site-specific DNA-methyltransferase [Deltaproteobacteria bacterium]